MGKKDHSWLNSGKYWWKLKLAGFYHPLWKHGERRLHAQDARHMDCAHVYDTKQVNESSHNTQTNEWHARTQKMRAGGVYPTPISLHLQQPLEKSVSRAQAGWVNVSAVPPQTNGVTRHFHLLAFSCEQSLYAFKQRWHPTRANHNSYCAKWKTPILFCI